MPRTAAAPKRAAAAAPAPHADNRTVILEAAADEFAARGFHGTTVRHVAERAGVSVGNLYNHFPGMKKLFETLLQEEEEKYFAPDSPLQKLFASFRFPEDLEKLADATQESVRRYARYLRLIYVDVLEFQGRHIARLFNDMRERYAQKLGPALTQRRRDGELGAGDPVTALMASTLLFFNYFAAEELFGARNHFGAPHKEAVAEICRLLRYGILPRK